MFKSHLELLNEQGYVVIPNVISEEQCDETFNEIWDIVRQLSNDRLTYYDTKTWTNENWPFSQGKKGIFQHYSSLSHNPAVWNIRQSPEVASVFSEIWNVKPRDLLVSFDGINVTLPPEITGKYSNPLGKDWQHKDQGPKKRGFHCVQGFVNIENTDEGDGCLVLRPGSHLLSDEFHEAFPEDFKGDWVKLEKKHIEWYDERCPETIRVLAPKGSLVLWDSRTIHANSTAQKGRINSDRLRMVVYVCMMPREGVSSIMLKKKIKYFEERRVTNHYPGQIKVFPKAFQTYGSTTWNESLEIDRRLNCEIKLTKLGERLVGY